ncbi:MAG: hypothetical protein M3173_05440 [Chloroflexota bacterium]|nr:hypothetical protein [Chloroflexota bacterium]
MSWSRLGNLAWRVALGAGVAVAVAFLASPRGGIAQMAAFLAMQATAAALLVVRV